jgi:hypothetical protein
MPRHQIKVRGICCSASAHTHSHCISSLHSIPLSHSCVCTLTQVMEFVFSIMTAFSDPVTRKKMCMVGAVWLCWMGMRSRAPSYP